MVKLEEVIDEEFLRAQEGPDDEDWDTDSGTPAYINKPTLTPPPTLKPQP
jgi:import receptor subunit TOM22